MEPDHQTSFLPNPHQTPEPLAQKYQAKHPVHFSKGFQLSPVLSMGDRHDRQRVPSDVEVEAMETHRETTATANLDGEQAGPERQGQD